MERQPVAAAAGDDAKMFLCPGDSLCHFADGPVPADGDDDVRVAVPGNLAAMAGIFRHLDGPVEATAVNPPLQHLQDLFLVLPARNRVDDENQFLQSSGYQRS